MCIVHKYMMYLCTPHTHTHSLTHTHQDWWKHCLHFKAARGCRDTPNRGFLVRSLFSSKVSDTPNAIFSSSRHTFQIHQIEYFSRECLLVWSVRHATCGFLVVSTHFRVRACVQKQECLRLELFSTSFVFVLTMVIVLLIQTKYSQTFFILREESQ